MISVPFRLFLHRRPAVSASEQNNTSEHITGWRAEYLRILLCHNGAHTRADLVQLGLPPPPFGFDFGRVALSLALGRIG